MTHERHPALIDRATDWHEASRAVGQTVRLGVDLEADGFHRYPEHVALIQLSLPDGTIMIVDPLAVDNLDPLGSILADSSVQKILHSADYDVRSFDRDFDYVIRGLFDTSIAAQFCGSERTGLGNVLAEYLGIDMPKPKRLQRFDWSRRPLPEDALEYAAGDVAHLHELADVLGRRLEDLGRYSWVAEECARQELVKYSPPDPPEKAYLSMRGARKLKPDGLAVLRELYRFREDEALRIGQPPYRVMTNQALLDLAENRRLDPTRVKGIRRTTLADARPQLDQALQRGRDSEPVRLERRRGRNPWTPDSRHRLSELKSWRNGESERLQLDRGVIWPAGHLNQLALHPESPTTALDVFDPPVVRRWQWEVLGPSLEAFRRKDLGDSVV